jgi:hypothetical protein
MVKRMFYLLSAVLLLSFTTGYAGAQSLARIPGTKPLQRSKPVKLFTGTFINPAGRVHQIQVMDGGHINIANTREGLFYRLHARTGEDGVAEVTIERYLDAEYSVMVDAERMDVPLDGTTKRSSLAPFRFTLDGERKALAEYRNGPAPNKAIGGECCIDCGDGWEVCCGVAVYERGWAACCEIDTSCAWCEVCAWSASTAQ